MWFILALLAGFLFAANKLIFRAVFTKGVNPIAFLSVHDFMAGILLLPIAIINFSLPQSGKTWMALILCVIFVFLADLFAALSLKNTEATLYQIVGQLRHIVVLIGAYFLFTEVITLSKVISIILIMLGVAVALLDKSKIKITRGIIDAVLSTIFIALAFLFVKMASVDVNPAVSASLSLLIAGVLSYLLLIVRKERTAQLIPKKNRKHLIIAAIIFAIFELVLFTALDIGEASRVTPVTQSSMVFTLIGGYLFLHERTRIKQKVLGSALIVAGIGLLYFV